MGSIAIHSTDVRRVSKTGEVLTAEGALDQDQMDRTWKGMQSATATKGAAIGYNVCACVGVCVAVSLCVCVCVCVCVGLGFGGIRKGPKCL